VVIPDLPEPHRHLACLALIGRPGAEVFDLDDVVEGTPRNTATLAVGTAATAPDWFRDYSVRRDCVLHRDGSHIQLGTDLTITGGFPTYRIEVDRPGLKLELDVTCTGQAIWFARSLVYEHVGYPARYEGTLTRQGERQPISGVLSLEHAQAFATTALRDRAVPERLKLPWNYFTYQVVDIAPGTLLMLADNEAWRQPVLTGAWVAELDGATRRHVSGEVTFDVLSYRPEQLVAPDGRQTRLPREFRWRIHREDGTVATEVLGVTDTDFIYGLGKGWIGGYSYTGHHDDEPVSGTAYMEYVRTR